MRSAVCRAALISSVVSSTASLVGAQAFTRIVNFGDSLSDVGNTNSITFGISPGSNYSNGRYSNGAVWTEDFAGDLHLAATVASRKGGLDYATGGSESGTGNVTPFPFVSLPNARTQIESFLGSKTPGADDLVTLWTGANDFLDGQTDPSVPAANVAAGVQRLVNAGVKNLLVVNLPPLGETPRYRNTTDRATMTARAAAFNAAVASSLDSIATVSPDVTLYRGDMFSLFNTALANPGAYGFTNVSDPALRSDNTVVSNPDQYLFYDTIHPTRTGHVVVANALFETVTLRTLNPVVNGGSIAWSSASNWQQHRVPDATSAVQLSASTPLDLTLTGDATVRTLSVGGTAAGTPSEATLHLAGGTLSVSQSAMTIRNGGTLAGRGTIGADLLIDTGGNISPGERSGGSPQVGQINVMGSLTFAAGTLQMDVGDLVSDRVVVGTSATLSGGTIDVRFINGYIGLPGKTVTVLNFASSAGLPGIVNQTGFAGLTFTPLVSATSLALRLDAVGGDANLDGHENFNDLLTLAAHYGVAMDQTWLDGDFTGDRRVTFDDLLVLAKNYEQTSAFAADWPLAQSLVPEPTSLVALPLVALAIRRRRDCRSA